MVKLDFNCESIAHLDIHILFVKVYMQIYVYVSSINEVS